MKSLVIKNACETDIEAIASLLVASNLTVEGLRTHLNHFAVACDEQGLVAIGGYERYAANALLRSVAVAPRGRGQGFARQMCDFIEAQAQRAGVKHLYLLTETAEGFFAGRGYQALGRELAPADIRATQQFSSLCPQSATFMHRAA